MAQLDEHSTIDDAIRVYRRSLSYESDGSLEKARGMIEAINYLLGMSKRARKGGSGGVEEEFDHEVMREQLLDARAYIQANGSDQPGVVDVDFTEFDRRT